MSDFFNILVTCMLSIAPALATINSTPPQLNYSAFDFNSYWGPEHQRFDQDTSIRPFRIQFDDQLIQDLRERLHRDIGYFAPPLEGVAFEYGFNTGQIDNWLSYWADEYPFKAREDFLNQFPQYKTKIQGLDIHFIAVSPQSTSNKEVVPLLMLHGWPGSVREFYEAISYVTADYTDKDFVVQVIAPSIPGFGFSDAAVRPGLSGVQIAILMRNLMNRLGHPRFFLQGGDIGGIISSYMVTLFPDEILGFHTNFAVVTSPPALLTQLAGAANPSLVVAPEYADRMYPLTKVLKFLIEELGYLHMQATKPDTIGVALTSSPAGLLAYFFEKFSTGTDPVNIKLQDGGLYNTFTREQLIDNLMMYWSRKTITPSMRFYRDTFNNRGPDVMALGEIASEVPTWVIQAKHEIIYQSPVILRQKYPNLLNATPIDHGGHFLALELPDEFSDSVLTAIQAFRSYHKYGGAAGY